MIFKFVIVKKYRICLLEKKCTVYSAKREKKTVADCCHHTKINRHLLVKNYVLCVTFNNFYHLSSSFV